MMQKCLCLNIRFAYAVTAAWNVDLPESQVAYFPDLFQSLLKRYFLRDLSLTTLCKTVFLFSCITFLAFILLRVSSQHLSQAAICHIFVCKNTGSTKTGTLFYLLQCLHASTVPRP